jgi:ankyrin repeat protein
MGLLDLVDLLLQRSADIHIADRRGPNALAIAAERAYSRLIEKFLELGADLDPASAERHIDNAERHGWTEAADLLRRIPARSERS